MKLNSWKESMTLAEEIYRIVRGFPKEELFALSSQIKRAAISIPSNIAEGSGRQTKKDSIRFFHIARGSLYELETLVTLGKMVGFIHENQFSAIELRIKNNQKLLNGLIRYYENASLE
ncbi:MAG: four helix bundle protein [Chitinophagaceae bacterium]|nr:four helix bundle protein [Chitinophagaceae bacterium]